MEDSLGYTEATVELVGDNRVTVDIPSINNPGMAANAITLEAGEYFVLGDNRNNSEDSRYADIGKVNKKYITGKLWFQISPRKEIGLLDQ